MNGLTTLYMNVYHSGHFHKRNKPDGNCNIHGGDCYLSRKDAEAAVDPKAPYVETVTFLAHVDFPLTPTTPDMMPMPIRESRGLMSEGAADWLVG